MYTTNKKAWRLLLGLVSVTFAFYLFQASFSSVSFKDLSNIYTSPVTDQLQHEQPSKTELDMIQDDGSSSPIETSEKMAFVTFLCDDIMGEATQVLVYSLRETKTQHDIVVLVLDEVTKVTRDRLEFLGAKIINVEQIKYPWESSSARRKGFNKACRYSKLNLWNLTQYKKVVFLDADTMVVNPIDELFEYPQFSAVVDIGGVMNTGVFVAEPNTDTYNDIMATYEDAPSYNRGDQGFLNYYFNQTANHLPGNYNLMVKFTHFSTLAASFIQKNTVKVIHFTSETKPWNFYFLHQREWRENYDGYLFGLWTRALRNLRSRLSDGGLWTNEMTDAAIWENKGRVEEICDHRLKRTYGRRYPKVNQLTVVVDLSKASINSKYLETLLRMYASSKKVAAIYINGNVFINENGERIALSRSYLRKFSLRKTIQAVPRGHFKSMNNKFNPIPGITTSSVFLADENVLISLQDLEFGYEVWKKHQDSIVGFKSDSHSYQLSTKKHAFIENFDSNAAYSMIKSNSMFMKTDFLYGYTCLMPEDIHRYIDLYPACHDIVINMLVSGQTGASPVLVHANHLFQFEDSHPQTIRQRSQCLDDLTQLFNGKNPLVLTNEIIVKTKADNVHTPSSWDQWASSVESIQQSEK